MTTQPRRSFLRDSLRGLLLLVTGGATGALAARRPRQPMVWQIDPFRCTQCGRCAMNCVLDVSAVKCVHDFAMCGYCELCTGFFRPDPNSLNSAAENQLCPVGALRRRFVEDPYFEHTVDEALCNGCGKCVKGCRTFGNGSLYLQVQHDRCLNCNECSIARQCPSGAYTRRPASSPYFVKHLGPMQT